jgi:hypothetical protein
MASGFAVQWVFQAGFAFGEGLAESVDVVGAEDHDFGG